MKRSSRVHLRLVPIVSAAFLSGCGPPEQKACVDQFKRVVDTANCQTPGGATGGFAPGGGYPYTYRWYWFRSAYMPSIGNLAPSDGGFTEPTLIDRIGRITTTRGGFGSSAGHSSIGA